MRILAVLLLVAGQAHGQEVLNLKLLVFCWQSQGRSVGGGQCGELAIEALKASGGRQPWVADDAVHWGDLLRTVTPGRNVKGPAEPGSIIFMRNIAFADARGVYCSTQQHTAVVTNVEDGGAVLDVLQQSPGGVVRAGRFHLADIQRGWLKVFAAKQ